MATYLELFSLKSNDTLRNKVEIACVIAAEAIRTEDSGTANHANRLLWAAQVFANPRLEAERMLMTLLAANSSLTTAQITGASDASIQTGVNNAVNVFAQG